MVSVCELAGVASDGAGVCTTSMSMLNNLTNCSLLYLPTNPAYAMRNIFVASTLFGLPTFATLFTDSDSKLHETLQLKQRGKAFQHKCQPWHVRH